MERKTATAGQDMGIRRLKASRRISFTTCGESTPVDDIVGGVDKRKGGRLSGKSMLVLSPQSCNRCKSRSASRQPYGLLLTSPPDHPWHTNTHRSPQIGHLWILSHPSRRPTRIYRVGQLRVPSKNEMVAKAMFHLFPRPPRNENLRLRHLPALSLDHSRGGLGTTLDGRKSDFTDLLRHAVFSCGHECTAVLHH